MSPNYMIIWQCVWNHHLFSSPCNCQSLLPRAMFHWEAFVPLGRACFTGRLLELRRHATTFFLTRLSGCSLWMFWGISWIPFPRFLLNFKKKTHWGLDVISQIFTELRGFGLVTVAIAMSCCFFPHDGISHCTVKTSHLNVKSKRYR